MSKVVTLSGLGQSSGDEGAPGCGGAAPGFCDNGSMWIPLTDSIDTKGLTKVNLADLPPHVCGMEAGSVYYYDPKDGRIYAVHAGACDYYWDVHNLQSAGDPSSTSSSPSISQTGEMKWYHFAALGGLGAGAGYLLFKDRGAGGVASVVGGGLSMLAVGAFRPGGWLRKDSKLAGRTLNTNQFKGPRK